MGGGYSEGSQDQRKKGALDNPQPLSPDNIRPLEIHSVNKLFFYPYKSMCPLAQAHWPLGSKQLKTPWERKNKGCVKKNPFSSKY